MSTKKIHTYNFDAIVDRIMSVKDLQHEYQVAEKLGFKRVAFSERKKRGSVPVQQLMLFCDEESINPNWLLTGQGEPFQTSEKHEGAASTEVPEEGFVKVPRYRVEASAGGGAVVESEQIVDYLRFSQSWLSHSLGMSPDHLALISVTGDSMSPTYNDGDLILIDTSSGSPKSDAVYVLQYEGFLWVKRLNFRFDGSIHVISDNPRYPEQVITSADLERLRIVGRVMWRGGR